MQRSISTAFIVLVFSLPCAMATSIVWPFIRHRQINHQIDGDLFLLATISLLGGIMITLVHGRPDKPAGEQRMR